MLRSCVSLYVPEIELNGVTFSRELLFDAVCSEERTDQLTMAVDVYTHIRVEELERVPREHITGERWPH